MPGWRCSSATAPTSPASNAPTPSSRLPSAPASRSSPETWAIPNCGLDAAAYQRLTAETTRVIHSAATVRFDHTLAEARAINVEGTRRVLDFAAAAPQFRSLAYVGTAYVAGDHRPAADNAVTSPSVYSRRCRPEASVRGGNTSRVTSLVACASWS